MSFRDVKGGSELKPEGSVREHLLAVDIGRLHLQHIEGGAQ